MTVSGFTMTRAERHSSQTPDSQAGSSSALHGASRGEVSPPVGYYTFSFGKLKIGVHENSSTVEAFTIGNIVFNSLQLAPLKPSFDHLTANFADKDYKFVNNSVTVYDIDRATLLGGAAGPLFLKSNVNLSGTCTKSQAARIISIRLREELGGTSIAEWKAARQLVFRTTVLA